MIFVLLLTSQAASADALPAEVGDAQLREWVEQMKAAPRGPFERIRWFCADGAVLPPGDSVCRERGGGVQHGQWNARALTLRSEGYLVATLLADIDPLLFVGDDPQLDDLRQILLEQFLIANDDGWVYRQARYYRGALQAEDEQAGARRLLMTLVDDQAWLSPTRFLLLREAARLLPLSSEPRVGAEVRKLAIEIAEADTAFAPLRVKIHGIPDARDAQLVRDYAKTRGRPELAANYEQLAQLLDRLNAPQTAVEQLAGLAGDIRDTRLKGQIRTAVDRLSKAAGLVERMQIASELAAAWRHRLAEDAELAPLNRVRLLLASLAVEQEIYAVGNQLIEQSAGVSRATRLQWLRSLGDALYGSGLLSNRQRLAIDREIAGLEQSDHLAAGDYYASLRYLARAPQWAQQAMEFQFSRTVQSWSVLTPLANAFVPDRLRSGPLLAYTRLLDGLIQDGSALLGIQHRVFGQPVGTGLRALNPGLRRGVLLLPPQAGGDFRRDGIYLLPSTTPELPPIAGILTRGEGSSLSHVQLLARNLGIPNVVIDEQRIAQIMPYVGKSIVLAVSARGAVEISEDGPQWERIFGRESMSDEMVIEPDLTKLDLSNAELLPLRDIRARDSGRIVGPKAANLGELRHNFPDAVNPGLAIPFGAFRALLEQPFEAGGPSAFDWMRSEYARIRAIGDATAQQQEASRFLARLRHWISATDPGEAFRSRLRTMMERVFGDADKVGVFVRSDTNVEDLPGFTGAGLNLTLPNVVGFDAVIKAIGQVWASPFTERAYAWRQSHMPRPEHVYPAVLLLETFPSEKSGVLVTVDVETGDPRWLSIAVGEGMGGAVDGQAVEELRVRRSSGEVRLLAQATAALRAEPVPQGGVRKLPASGRDALLNAVEIDQLRSLADEVERRLPMPKTDRDKPAPADIEFGFADGRLALFQIRPFVESMRARRSTYLINMDRSDIDAAAVGGAAVDLQQPPLP